jgi:hypothetical protein
MQSALAQSVPGQLVKAGFIRDNRLGRHELGEFFDDLFL